MILNETYPLANGVQIPKLGLGPGLLTMLRQRKPFVRRSSWAIA